MKCIALTLVLLWPLVGAPLSALAQSPGLMAPPVNDRYNDRHQRQSAPPDWSSGYTPIYAAQTGEHGRPPMHDK